MAALVLIETYVQLSGEDAAEYQRLLNLKKNKEIRQTWLGKAEARGWAEGQEKGVQMGRQQGIKKGQAEGLKKGRAEAVDRMRELVRSRIEQRFGAVPERIQAKVRTIQMLEKLPLLESAEDFLARRRRSNGHA